MVSAVHASARVFRVRTEFITLTREMRVHVLCECGSGAWIAAIAPFPDLFFDERPLIGRSVGDALVWLGAHYSGLRILADILDSYHGRGGPRHSERKAAPVPKPGVELQPEVESCSRVERRPEVGFQPEGKRKPRRRAAGQCELPLSVCR